MTVSGFKKGIKKEGGIIKYLLVVFVHGILKEKKRILYKYFVLKITLITTLKKSLVSMNH